MENKLYNNLNTMGSTDSIPQNNSHRLNRENWQPAPSSQNEPLRLEYGRRVRLRNNMTGEELDEYELTFNDIDEYRKYMQIHYFRNQHEYLVPIAYVNQQKIKHVCSHIYYLKIYIEHIPLRLCDIKDIPFPENLYVMIRTLKGLKILFDQVGHFHVTEDLMCISEEGIAKVWLNSDLSKDYAQNLHNQVHYNKFRKQLDTGDQNSMVWEVITLINQLTNKQSLPGNGYSFIQFLKASRKSHLDFLQAINLISKYAQQTHVDIPEVFYSAIKIIREKKGIFQSEADITLNNRINNDDLESVIRKGRFKQSEVERVHDFKNYSVGSYAASQSNHTYADKLKKFDNQTKNNFNVFGGLSGIKETPIKRTSVFKVKKQPNTDRAAANLLSYSEISSPPGTQSLTMIGPLMHPSVVHISSSNSQIISNSKSIGIANDGESPLKQKDKPQTYFSQYIEQDQNNFIKKQKQFSFGHQDAIPQLNSSQSRNKLLKNIPIFQSMINSKAEVRVFSCQKPVVTFTYSLNPSLRQSMISNDQMNPNLQASIPISPPSVDRSLLSKMVDSINKKVEQNQKYRQNQFLDKQEIKTNELLKFQTINQSLFKHKEIKKQLKMTKQIQIKIKPTNFELKQFQRLQNASQNNVKSNIEAKETLQQQQKLSIIERIHQNKTNNADQNPEKFINSHLKQKMQNFEQKQPTIYKNRPRMQSEKIKREPESLDKQIPTFSQSETPILKLNQDLVLLPNLNRIKSPSKKKKREVNEKELAKFLQVNSLLNLDPEIAVDLMIFERKQKQKERKEKEKQNIQHAKQE